MMLALGLTAIIGCADRAAESETIGVRRRVLFDFDDPAEVAPWQSADDTVMGGESQSRLVYVQGGTAAFAGTVSLANQGGFASVRAPLPDGALAGCEGLVLRVRGDGRRYILYVTTGPDDEGPRYQAAFDTRTDQWRKVLAPFVEFAPYRRGERLAWQRVPAGEITGIGLMISEPHEGPFSLEIDTIEAYWVPGG